MSYFTPISNAAFSGVIDRLPKRHKHTGALLIAVILFRSNRQEGWFNGEHLERGQFPFGWDELSRSCHLSVQQTRTLISHLEKVEFLTSKSTNAGSIGTVINFDGYVIDGNETNKQINRQLTDDQQTTNNAVKDKSKKINVPPPARARANTPDLDDDSSYEAECYAAYCEIAPGEDADYPPQFFAGLKRQFGDELPILVLHRFIHTIGTRHDLDAPDNWRSYIWAMCQRHHTQGDQPNAATNGHTSQWMGGSTNRNDSIPTFEDIFGTDA